MIRSRSLAALFGAAVLFTACGGADEATTQAGSPADPSPATPAAPGDAPSGDVGPPSQAPAPADVPDVEVAAIPSGDRVNLQTLAQGNDTLFWFWAPH